MLQTHNCTTGQSAYIFVQAARNRFNEFLHMASMPADEADVERVRRERREAAVKDVKGAAGGSAAKEVRRRHAMCAGPAGRLFVWLRQV
jgi:hypothetical protein